MLSWGAVPRPGDQLYLSQSGSQDSNTQWNQQLYSSLETGKQKSQQAPASDKTTEDMQGYLETPLISPMFLFKVNLSLKTETDFWRVLSLGRRTKDIQKRTPSSMFH